MKTALAFLAAAAIAGAAGWFLNEGRQVPAERSAVAGAAMTGDPFAGKRAFVSEGCVLCHAVRGVGGRIGPTLDVEDAGPARSPMDFAARMWRGAGLMVEMQQIEFGYQIALEGRELADLAAFAASEEAQDTFSAEDVPLPMQDLFLDELSWDEDLADRYEGEEWYDYDEEYYEEFEDREYAPERP